MGRARALVRPARGAARRVAGWWAARREQLAVQRYEGLTLCYPSRSTVGADLAAGVGWESAVREIVGKLETDAPFLVDVGSNVGTSVLQFKLAKPHARVLCIEGSPRFLPGLRATIAANGWTDVELEATLVGAEPGEAVIFSSTGTASVAARQYGGHDPVREDAVPMQRLDDLLQARPEPALIKSDTDGFDADVLLGARRTLELASPALYFEFAPFLLAQAGRDHELVPRYLAELGYDAFVLLRSTGQRLALERDPQRVAAIAAESQYVDVLALFPKREHEPLRRWAGLT